MGFLQLLLTPLPLQLQRDFNKNLSATLDEKKADLKKVKEAHYSEINALKKKMNDCVRF